MFVYRGSYLSVHVLMILSNVLWIYVKMRGLSSNLLHFCKEFNKFNNAGARMLDSNYNITLKLTKM